MNLNELLFTPHFGLFTLGAIMLLIYVLYVTILLRWAKHGIKKE
jgi:hypothetical protein